MNDDLRIELGRVVENAGALEHVICGVILALARIQSNECAIAVGACGVPDMRMVDKISTLKNLATAFVPLPERETWIDLANELDRLTQYRNRLLHDFVAVRETDLLRVRRKGGKYLENEHSVVELKEFNQDASDRRRQMMDFLDTLATTSPDDPFVIQTRFPRLKPDGTWSG